MPARCLLTSPKVLLARKLTSLRTSSIPFACLSGVAASACIQLKDAFVRLSGLKGHGAPQEFLLPPGSGCIEQNISHIHRLLNAIEPKSLGDRNRGHPVTGSDTREGNSVNIQNEPVDLHCRRMLEEIAL